MTRSVTYSGTHGLTMSQRRLAQENPAWREQKSVTIRFRHQLDLQAVPLMRDRIISEATLSRRMHDALAAASITENVTFSIDPRSLQAVDGAGARDVLVKEGMTIVSSGHPNEALRLMGLLDPTVSQEARIALVAAYAHFELGQYFHARACAASARSGESELSQADRSFLAGLIDTCDFRLGVLSSEEFERREQSREQQTSGPLQSFNRLERIRRSALAITDLTERARIVGELKEAAARILSDPDAAQPMKLHARIELLYSEGTELNLATVHQYFLILMRRQIGASPTLPNAQSDLEQRQQVWIQEANAVVTDAVGLRHPLIIAHAMFTRAAICISKMLMIRLLDCYKGGETAISPEWICFVEADLKAVSEIYLRSGSTEGLLRAKMAFADLLELSSRLDDAKSMAEQVVARAAAMGLTQLAQRAQDVLAGTTTLAKERRNQLASKTRDSDEDWVNLSDSELRERAKGLLEARCLGPERLSVIERDYLVTRDAARERVEWCRHLQILQDLTHLDSSATAYQQDPNRMCCCKKHGWRTTRETPDHIKLTADFKGEFCDGCADRSPKRVLTTSAT
jgi:hypothetical protein